MAEHTTRVYLGNWSAWAYCTCGWEGPKTDRQFPVRDLHEEVAEEHKRKAASLLTRYLEVRKLKRYADRSLDCG